MAELTLTHIISETDFNNLKVEMVTQWGKEPKFQPPCLVIEHLYYNHDELKRKFNIKGEIVGIRTKHTGYKNVINQEMKYDTYACVQFGIGSYRKVIWGQDSWVTDYPHGDVWIIVK